jgi:hypothetical protein
LSGFFTYLSKKGIFGEWASVLDWFLSSKHFDSDKWDDYISVFTKNVKKIKCIENAEIKYDVAGKLKFPAKRPKSTKIIHAKTKDKRNGGGLGRDFVRHIRNGIAHGRLEIIPINKEDFIEIKDYSNDKLEQQTAYIFVPRDCLIEIYMKYLKLKEKMDKTSND